MACPRLSAEATAASEGADAVLVVGPSVSTFSAFPTRSRRGAARGAPVAVLTAGETRVDPLATLKVERLAGETLPRGVGGGAKRADVGV